MTKTRFKLPVAVFMLILKGDEILMLKRHGTGKRDGQFSVPAGSLEENEDLLSAAIREAEEEVGVRIKKEDAELVSVIHCNIEGENWINVFFATQKWEGTPKICEPHKHSDLNWYTTDQLPENTVEYVKKAIENLEGKVFYDLSGW